MGETQSNINNGYWEIVDIEELRKDPNRIIVKVS